MMTYKNKRDRGFALGFLFIGLIFAMGACNGTNEQPQTTSDQTRTWDMGFYTTAPRYGDITMGIENIDLLSNRSEAVMIHEELPWDLLLDRETDMETILDSKASLITYLRNKGLKIFFMADLTDGLSRGEEAPILRELDRSITEADVQQRYRDNVLAFVLRFQPEVVGLTAETNLVRKMADSSVYSAMVTAANNAAEDLIQASVSATLSISVQVETAWGVLSDTGPYVGVEQDFNDFPFIEVLGLSSYPYFGYAEPENIPDNYYTRLLNGRSLPVMVCEGGWPGSGVDSIESSPQLQARYIARHADLLDGVKAQAVIQILFTDLDLSSLPTPYSDNLPLFSTLGLMVIENDDFSAKPGLTEWDSLFSRTHQ